MERQFVELTLPITWPLPDLERLGDWLGDNRPDSPAATLVHGDYKLDNVMFKDYSILRRQRFWTAEVCLDARRSVGRPRLDGFVLARGRRGQS